AVSGETTLGFRVKRLETLQLEFHTVRLAPEKAGQNFFGPYPCQIYLRIRKEEFILHSTWLSLFRRGQGQHPPPPLRFLKMALFKCQIAEEVESLVGMLATEKVVDQAAHEIGVAIRRPLLEPFFRLNINSRAIGTQS